MNPDPAIIRRLVDTIVRVAQPLRIVLFGSAALGELTPDGDLDVLVIMPEGTHCREAAGRMYRALIGLGAAKDLIVTTPSILAAYGEDDFMIYRPALLEGRELYRAAA